MKLKLTLPSHAEMISGLILHGGIDQLMGTEMHSHYITETLCHTPELLHCYVTNNHILHSLFLNR